MIVSQLCSYYDYMVQGGKTLPEGYSSLPMNYLVCLTSEGTIDEILFCGKQDGKQMRFEQMLLPLRTQKPGIDSNIIEHRPNYLFGLGCEKGAFSCNDSKAKKSHAAFREANLAFTEGMTSPIATAYRNFILNWKAEEHEEDPHLLAIAKDYSSSRFAFCLTGHPEMRLHEEVEVKRKWDALYAERASAQDETVAECAVFGEELPIAKLHDKIKGVKGGQASGCVLVCVNNPSENSYGKEQSFNCSISVPAMKQYTSALNYLLSDRTHRTTLDNMTIVHFALSKQEDRILNFMNFMALGSDSMTTEETDETLQGVMQSVREGKACDFSVFDDREEETEYCIFGLVPNSARIAVRFCYCNQFGVLRRNIERWHQDFALDDRLYAPEIWKLKSALKAPKSTADLAPDLEEKLLFAMLNGAPLPVGILQTVIRRIKTDTDIPYRETQQRMALLKACLNRKRKRKEEQITVALNEENQKPAYLCGRLFAILEKVQQDAANGSLNRTIKDAFFASAMSTPCVIFARLIKLNKNHLAKLSDGSRIYYSRRMGEIMDRLEAFPKTLSLEEQGDFILGYYQQNAALYAKKEQNQED